MLVFTVQPKPLLCLTLEIIIQQLVSFIKNEQSNGVRF